MMACCRTAGIRLAGLQESMQDTDLLLFCHKDTANHSKESRKQTRVYSFYIRVAIS
jgi:hypothetical protein